MPLIGRATLYVKSTNLKRKIRVRKYSVLQVIGEDQIEIQCRLEKDASDLTDYMVGEGFSVGNPIAERESNYGGSATRRCEKSLKL